MSRPAKKPTPRMEPNAMPSLRLVDKPCRAVLTLFFIMLRSGTLEGQDFVSEFFFFFFGQMDELGKTDFSMRGAYADPRFGL